MVGKGSAIGPLRCAPLRAARAASFDYPVGAQEYRCWNRNAQGLGGPRVDNKLELCRLLDRQIARLRALEDLVHIAGGTPEVVQRGWSVGKQDACIRKL